MKALLSTLVILLAAGGVAWVAFGDGADGGGGDPLDGEALPDDGAGVSPPLTVEAAAVIGVVGEAGSVPLQVVDFGAAMEVPVRLPADAGPLTGGHVLAALETHVGSKLPIRFASQAALASCRGADLGVASPPAEADVPMLLDWLRHAGWVTVQRDTYLFVHRARD